MVNRIDHWWKDVLKWKERFENLFQSMGLNPEKDKAFKKEELRKYERILSRKLKNMTPEELMMRRRLKAERNKLEKQLYTNPAIRLYRNLYKVGSSVIGKLVSGITPDTSKGKEARLLDTFGLSEMKADKKEHAYKSTHSESLAKGEILDFRLKYEDALNGRSILKGYEASLKNINGKLHSVLINASMNINKNQVRELLNGRSICMQGDNWLVPDLNDRDANGYIKLREISIQDFDIKQKLLKIPGVKLNDTEVDKLFNGLKNGKRMDMIIKSGRINYDLTIETNPLKRELIFFQNDKKISLDKLVSVQKQNPKILKMEHAKSTKKQMKI